jgi:hypothetical protein
MKHSRKRYSGYLSVLSVLLLVLLWFQYNGKITNEIFFGGIATLLTLFLSIINYHQANDKFFKELYIEFNGRYDRMNDFLNSLNDDSLIVKNEDKQKIIDYLILCSEEYMWVKKGRIPTDVWENWKSGIKFHVTKKSIKKIYDEEHKQKKSYYGFFEEMDKYLTKGPKNRVFIKI